MANVQILDQTALAALVMVALSLLKPLVELVPFARPSAPLHNYILQGLLFALNILALVLNGIAANTLHPAAGQNAVTVGLWIVYQAAIASGLSHLAYQGITKLRTAPASDPAGLGDISEPDSAI